MNADERVILKLTARNKQEALTALALLEKQVNDVIADCSPIEREIVTDIHIKAKK